MKAISVLLLFAGLIVCMCETPDLSQQIIHFCIGIGLAAIGAIIALVSKEEQEHGTH